MRRSTGLSMARARHGDDLQAVPREALVSDRFGGYALDTMDTVQWIEPIWKMLWSNKALLAVLWEMYPGHQLLLPAYLDGPREMESWVRKPLLGREGANVTVKLRGSRWRTPQGDMRTAALCTSNTWISLRREASASCWEAGWWTASPAE